MIPELFLKELLSRVDIVDVIGRYVPLKKAGKSYMACCPFHKEKSPSFSVSREKQFFYCFGCQASGNAIHFVMRQENLSFPEAVRKLAEANGMQVPEERRSRERRARAKSLTDLMGEAQEFYRKGLAQSSRAQEYLKARGITEAVQARFGLGFSPDQWQGLQAVFGVQYSSAALEEKQGCGLVIHSDNGRAYDRFRGRIMFPIRNRRGLVIGFGARTMNGDEHPKYLNSPETAIYHKGEEIYGLYEAAEAIRDKKRAIVVEGYMDVIQLSQAGFPETVAALGTALTAEHVTRLLRMTDTVYFSFDGDPPGQHALERAMAAALPVVTDTQTLRFVVLPPEHDPDSLIKASGAAAFERELEKSLPLSEFLLRHVRSGLQLSTSEGRTQAVARAKPLLASMRQAPLLRAQLLSQLAMLAGTTADETARQLGIAAPSPRPLVQAPSEGPRWKNRWKNGPARRAPVRELPARTQDKLRVVLRYLLSFPQLAQEFSGPIEELAGSGTELEQQVLEVWRAAASDEAGAIRSTAELLAALEESPHRDVYQRLVASELELETPLTVARLELGTAFYRLELEQAEAESSEIALSPTPDLERLRVLQQSIRRLKERLVQLQQEQTESLLDEEAAEREESVEPEALRRHLPTAPVQVREPEF